MSTPLKVKIGEDIEDYLILGACNSALAHRAIEVDRQIGLLLPCNVVGAAIPPRRALSLLTMDPQVTVCSPTARTARCG